MSRVAAISGVEYLNPDCTFLGPGGGIWQAGRGPVVDGDGMVYFFTGNKAHIIKNGCMIPQNSNPCAACSSAGGCLCKGIGSPKVCRGPDTCMAHEARNHQLFDVNESLIQLNPADGLKLTGWFRPANWDDPGPDGLEMSDLDLGGSGPVLIPGTHATDGRWKAGRTVFAGYHAARLVMHSVTDEYLRVACTLRTRSRAFKWLRRRRHRTNIIATCSAAP